MTPEQQAEQIRDLYDAWQRATEVMLGFGCDPETLAIGFELAKVKAAAWPAEEKARAETEALDGTLAGRFFNPGFVAECRRLRISALTSGLPEL